MLRLTIDIMDPCCLGPMAAKESVAMALEHLGQVRVVRVQDSEGRVRVSSWPRADKRYT